MLNACDDKTSTDSGIGLWCAGVDRTLPALLPDASHGQGDPRKRGHHAGAVYHFDAGGHRQRGGPLG